MAYVKHGEGDPILLLHGERTWSYLYRDMIPPLAQDGRVIAPDLIGFGRSDKPAAANAYTYKSHVRWLRGFIQALNLERITMVYQDWGGSLGLRVLSQMSERFARLVAMNTGVRDGTAAMVFPRLMPIRPDAAGAYDNRVAIERLKTLDLPVLLLSADDDPITARAKARLRQIFKNVAPKIVVQEDAGEEVAGHILKWNFLEME
jgi:pimeloyl-ACP methyl ester carboxylesterase